MIFRMIFTQFCELEVVGPNHANPKKNTPICVRLQNTQNCPMTPIRHHFSHNKCLTTCTKLTNFFTVCQIDTNDA